ncbi:hypothetical protein ACHAPU_009574 [Fusarium lateritium]
MDTSPRFSLRHWPCLFLLWCLAGISDAQNDPIKNFCRRWGHQSAVVDRKLYIDGGLIDYQPSYENLSSRFPPSTYWTSANTRADNFLAYNDLDSLSKGGMPPLYANLSKNDTIPSVNGAVMWEDTVNKRIYLYGGEYFDMSPLPFYLYSYDILNDEWITHGSPPDTVEAASYGAGVSISLRGEAYYYGGWLSNSSIKDWKGPPRASNGLIKYEMDSNTWSNLTGPDNVGRAEGAMVYVPVGDAGMLVYFGGSQDLYGNGTLTPQPLDEIFLFDVANAKWYTQKTSGDVPDDRRLFCGGATWAKDQSSYNVYIYGGAGFPPAVGYDDIYILTIPSFQWIRGPYPTYRNGTGAYPKSMMSCSVVDNAQMLVIGGTYLNATEDTCDVPTIQGAHNMNLGQQNADKAVWAQYQPNLTTYVVPTDIVTAVGGSKSGGATKTTPVSGFDAPDLAVQMTRTAVSGTRTATRQVETTTRKPQPSASHTNKPSPSLGGGAIAGIAVGCSVAGVLALAGCIFLFRRRRKYYSTSHGAPAPVNDMTMAQPNPGPATGQGWDFNQTSPLSGVSPSYFDQQSMQRIEPPAELTSNDALHGGDWRTSPLSATKAQTRRSVDPPAELVGEGEWHYAYTASEGARNPDGLSPLSSNSHPHDYRH